MEVLQGTHDFQSYYHSLDLQFTGLAACHTGPRTNHVWRFVQRHVANRVLPAGAVIENHVEGFQELMEDPKDCILITKEYLHSAAMSQAPILVLPHAVAAKLDGKDLKQALPLALGESTIKEFRKTAKAVGSHPWELLKAQAFLEKLCDRNEKNYMHPMAPLDFVHNYRMVEIVIQESVGDATLHDDGPRQITVTNPTAAERRKRGKRKADISGARLMRGRATDPSDFDMGVEGEGGEQADEEQDRPALAGPDVDFEGEDGEQADEGQPAQPGNRQASEARVMRRPAAAAGVMCRPWRPCSSGSPTGRASRARCASVASARAP